MEHQQNDIQTSLVKTNQFYVAVPAPKLGRPARCVSCWCCTCVFGAWWDFHFSFQVRAFSGVWDVGVNLPKMAEKNRMSFFLVLNGRVTIYQPPPLIIMKKWNVYTVYIYTYYNFVECYRHVTNMWNVHLENCGR